MPTPCATAEEQEAAREHPLYEVLIFASAATVVVLSGCARTVRFAKIPPPEGMSIIYVYWVGMPYYVWKTVSCG